MRWFQWQSCDKMKATSGVSRIASVCQVLRKDHLIIVYKSLRKVHSLVENHDPKEIPTDTRPLVIDVG